MAEPAAASPAEASPTPARTGEGRKREIIARAADLFDELGYNHASMEDLAEAVGLAKPTLYHYFSGKEEILYRVHQEFIILLIARQESRAASGLDPAEQLRAIMGDILELMETHRGHVRVFFEHHRELPTEWHHAVSEHRAQYQSMVETVVAAGMAAGQFRRADLRLTTLAIFGLCNWAYQWYRAQGPLRPREIADFFFDLIGSGLLVEPQPLE